MKALILLSTMFLVFGLQAQMTSGTIVFESKMRFTPERQEKYSEVVPVEITQFRVDFDEHTIKMTQNAEENNNYSSIIDKATGETVVCITDESQKTVRFIRTDYSDDSLYVSEYGDNEEAEDKKTKSDSYSNKFYQELMSIPVNDTIIIRTKEVKDILGYSCKKSILKIGSQKIVVWTTEEIIGIDEVFKLPAALKGSTLCWSTEGGGYTFNMEAISINSVNPLTSLGFIPEGYHLDLGTVYADTYDSSFSENEVYNDNPKFIGVPNYNATIKSILSEIVKEIKHKKQKKGDRIVYISLVLEMDESGKIVSVINYDPEEENKINFPVLIKNIKQNCAFKEPITIKGTGVASTITINYTYSTGTEDQ